VRIARRLAGVAALLPYGGCGLVSLAALLPYGGCGLVSLAALLLCGGCGLVSLAHDSVVGPVSPVGRIHSTTVGSDFRVTEQGPVADLAGDARLRPLPRDLLARMAAPRSFWSLAQGIQAFLASISPVASRESRTGRLALAGERPALAPGTTVSEALARLGAPDLWLRRETGSLLLYRVEQRRRLSFYLGVPPPAAALVPVPGIGNLHFRYASETERAEKLLLFFDRDDRLLGSSASAVP